jgi:hypothetical protein
MKSKLDILQDTVTQLHLAARNIEQIVGQGQLAEDIRQCADRLSILISPLKFEDKNV